MNIQDQMKCEDGDKWWNEEGWGKLLNCKHKSIDP